MKKTPPKAIDIIRDLGRLLADGRYLETLHAQKRMRERDITTHDIWRVLRTGFHEKRKDEYDEAFQAWKYAIRGQFPGESRTLRIIVAIAEDLAIVVTAIDLTQEVDK